MPPKERNLAGSDITCSERTLLLGALALHALALLFLENLLHFIEGLRELLGARHFRRQVRLELGAFRGQRVSLLADLRVLGRRLTLGKSSQKTGRSVGLLPTGQVNGQLDVNSFGLAAISESAGFQMPRVQLDLPGNQTVVNLQNCVSCLAHGGRVGVPLNLQLAVAIHRAESDGKLA